MIGVSNGDTRSLDYSSYDLFYEANMGPQVHKKYCFAPESLEMQAALGRRAHGSSFPTWGLLEP